MATLTFGSFPRSGSHFFSHLTNCKWISHHISALSNSENIVVSIRNPMECVPSWIVLTDDHRIDRAEKVLEWYSAYYQRCKELDLLIIPFDQLIADPLFCINHALSRYGIDPLDSLEFDLSSGFHYPTSDKTEYDRIIEEMLDSSGLGLALNLFEELSLPIG